MSTRERVQRLVDLLPVDQLPDVERFIRGILATDPVLAAVAAAPEDDEPYTEEQQQADRQAWERYRRGDYVRHEGLLHRAKDRAA